MAKEKKNDDVSVKEEKSTEKTAKKEKDSSKKAKKDEKKSGGIGKWFHDLKVEFRNVTWPTRQTVAVNTGVVLSVIVAGSVIIGLLDSGLLKLAQFLIGLAQG